MEFHLKANINVALMKRGAMLSRLTKRRGQVAVSCHYTVCFTIHDGLDIHECNGFISGNKRASHGYLDYAAVATRTEPVLDLLFNLEMQRRTLQPGCSILIAYVYVRPDAVDIYQSTRRTNLTLFIFCKIIQTHLNK